LYRSIYQYNDALSPETEPDGLSYSQITEQYFRTELSKENMTGSAASSSVVSSAASSSSTAASSHRYERDASFLTQKSAYDGEEIGKKPVTRQSAVSTTDVSSDLNDDAYLQTSQIATKTFARLNKKDLGSQQTSVDGYIDGYERGATYRVVSSEPRPSEYDSPSGNGVSDAAGAYYAPSSDGSSYETPAPVKRCAGDGYDTSAPNGDTYSVYAAGTSYETSGNTPGAANGYETSTTSTTTTSANGSGFQGLNQTQAHLMAAAHSVGLTAGGPREIPLYIESQKTDFFKSFSWNERWQALLERPTMTPEEIRQRGEDIHQLTEEFLQVARPIVAKIVEELHLPDDQKTFKPVDVGGVAGGEKFMAKQLFLKYARDNIKLRLYNGDAWAQKAAIHELKSLNALIACNIPNLHFPLMACLSCYGHYIVVVSKLPLSKNTLVYGSANVAQTIMTDREVGQLFKQAAEKLNLESHMVVEGLTKLEKTMYGPVDIEGHKGMDGRSYIVDTARLFPPAPPIRGVRGCHLYKLLRKELVRTNPVPLSSDAFSFFGKVNADHHNLEVKNAANRIFQELIPGLLHRPDINELITSGNVTDLIHSVGINVRFLGCILASALNMPAGKISDESIDCLMLEMVARASKGVFFQTMRNDVDVTKPKRDECRRLAAEHWNYLLFSQANYLASAMVQSDPTTPFLSKESVANWWSSELIPTLKQRFVFFSGDPEWVVPLAEQLEASANDILTPELFDRVMRRPADLFNRTRQISGIVFSDALLSEISNRGHSFFFANTRLLQTEDVTEILIQDKRVQYVPFVDIKGAGRFEDAERFYLAEIDNRVRALGRIHPQVALSYRHLGELYADQRGFEEKAKAAYTQAVEITKAYHKTASSQRTRDLCDILNLDADLFIKYDRVQSAQDTLLELLDLFRPDSVPSGIAPLDWISTSISDMDQMAEIAPVLDKLARVQVKMSKFAEAEQLYHQSRLLKERVFGPDHWQVARTLNGHAQLMFAQNRLAEAKEMCLRVKSLTEASRGLYHSEVGVAMDNLARVLSAEQQFDQADAMLKAALEIKIKSLGEHHSFVAMTWDHLASNRFQRLLFTSNTNVGGSPSHHSKNQSLPREDLEDIATLYMRALETIESSLGKSHSAYATTKSNLAVITTHLKEWDKALDMARDSYDTLKSALGDSHPSVTVAKSNMEFISKSAAMPPTIIPTEALKMVYHAQYISSNAPERSRIPDKIRQLLEKKGLAVTEANAQKVADMLRKKKQQAAGYGTTYASTTMTTSDPGTGYGSVASMPVNGAATLNMSRSTSKPLSRAQRRTSTTTTTTATATANSFDGYENAPSSAPVSAVAPTESSEYASSYGDAGYGYGVQDPYERSGKAAHEAEPSPSSVPMPMRPTAPSTMVMKDMAPEEMSKYDAVATEEAKPGRATARATRDAIGDVANETEKSEEGGADEEESDMASVSEAYDGDTGDAADVARVEAEPEPATTTADAELQRKEEIRRLDKMIGDDSMVVEDVDVSRQIFERGEQLDEGGHQQQRHHPKSASGRGIIDALLSCFRSKDTDAPAPSRRTDSASMVRGHSSASQASSGSSSLAPVASSSSSSSLFSFGTTRASSSVPPHAVEDRRSREEGDDATNAIDALSSGIESPTTATSSTKFKKGKPVAVTSQKERKKKKKKKKKKKQDKNVAAADEDDDEDQEDNLDNAEDDSDATSSSTTTSSSASASSSSIAHSQLRSSTMVATGSGAASSPSSASRRRSAAPPGRRGGRVASFDSPDFIVSPAAPRSFNDGTAIGGTIGSIGGGGGGSPGSSSSLRELASSSRRSSQVAVSPSPSPSVPSSPSSHVTPTTTAVTSPSNTTTSMAARVHPSTSFNMAPVPAPPRQMSMIPPMAPMPPPPPPPMAAAGEEAEDASKAPHPPPGGAPTPPAIPRSDFSPPLGAPPAPYPTLSASTEVPPTNLGDIYKDDLPKESSSSFMMQNNAPDLRYFASSFAPSAAPPPRVQQQQQQQSPSGSALNLNEPLTQTYYGGQQMLPPSLPPSVFYGGQQAPPKASLQQLQRQQQQQSPQPQQQEQQQEHGFGGQMKAPAPSAAERRPIVPVPPADAPMISTSSVSSSSKAGTKGKEKKEEKDEKNKQAAKKDVSKSEKAEAAPALPKKQDDDEEVPDKRKKSTFSLFKSKASPPKPGSSKSSPSPSSSSPDTAPGAYPSSKSATSGESTTMPPSAKAMKKSNLGAKPSPSSPQSPSAPMSNISSAAAVALKQTSTSAAASSSSSASKPTVPSSSSITSLSDFDEITAPELLMAKQSSYFSPSARDARPAAHSSSTATEASPSSSIPPSVSHLDAVFDLSAMPSSSVSHDMGTGAFMDAEDNVENDLAADELFNAMDDADLEDLDLDEEETGTPAPHTGPNWGWSAM